MGDVRPFCGLRYNLQRITDPSTVVTPPYDLISPDERSQYYRRSPYNIIRLESGEEQPGDSPENNKYTRAAAALDDWLREGILIQETQPALYVVEHRFPYQDMEESRWGLIARVRLEGFESGQIRPHERTKREPSVDRLQLLRSCRANVSPIMGLLRTDEGEMLHFLHKLCTKAPNLSAKDSHDVTYRMWVVTDEAAIDKASAFLADKVIYIADGHHRYKSALRHQQEQQATHSHCTGDEPFNFVMMALMDSQDPGLVMLPIHWLVRVPEPPRVARLLETVSPYFHLEELPPPSPTPSDTVREWLRTLEMRGQSGALLGLYGLHEQKFCLLRLRRDADLRSLMTKEELGLWRDLDVVLLQRVILQAPLGIDTPEKEVNYLQYTLDGLEAKSRVDSGEYQLAFFLNTVPVPSVLDTADAGMTLPRKSTHFYPKTPAGLVINPVWDED